MQRYFINSLKNQTDLSFTVCIITGPPNNEATMKIMSLDWEGLNVKFIHVNDDLSTWKASVQRSRNFGQEKDPGCPEYIVKNSNHPLTNIMARLDTDDWVAPGWIAHMKHMAATKSESHFLINYQVIGQGEDGRLYHFFASHNHVRTSPFIALVQKESPRISPYKDTHLKMGNKFSTVYTIPPSYVFMVIHGENRSNRLYQFDKYYEDIDPVKKTKSISVPKSINLIKQHRQQLQQQFQGSDWKSRIARAQTV